MTSTVTGIVILPVGPDRYGVWSSMPSSAACRVALRPYLLTTVAHVWWQPVDTVTTDHWSSLLPATTTAPLWPTQL
jgi:hypothetical protein